MDSDVCRNRTEYDKGYDCGFDKGYDIGFNEGYDKGYIAGYDKAVKNDWLFIEDPDENPLLDLTKKNE